MKPKYNIGDVVWYAGRTTKTEKIVCPECFGKKQITVILGNDEKVIIDCMGCAPGLENPKGYCEYWKQDVEVRQVVISGVEYNNTKTTYRFDGCYSVEEAKVFDNKSDAEAKARELAEQHNKEELERINRKEKNHKNWSWHVSYYRKKIASALKEIEYAEARLHIAKEKSEIEKKITNTNQ